MPQTQLRHPIRFGFELSQHVMSKVTTLLKTNKNFRPIVGNNANSASQESLLRMGILQVKFFYSDNLNLPNNCFFTSQENPPAQFAAR